jgi:hypothetical protein
MAIITMSSTISGQLMLITPAEKHPRLGYSYIVSGCVVESAKEFLAALLMSSSIREFVNQSAYCILVTNGELVRVASHDRTSFSENYTAQGSSSSEEYNRSREASRRNLEKAR